MNKITLIRDSRERPGRGWTFEAYDDIVLVKGKLDAGDYALQGAEKELVIERKGDTDEIKNNTSERQIDRFHRAIEELMTVKHPFMFIEGKLTDFYAKMNFTKLNPNASLLFLMPYQLRGLNVVYCEGRGQWLAANLFRTYARQKGIV